ncbi:MAG: hypothetical protein ACLQVX_18650 [Limisphaerales bacterium]
MKRGDDTLEPKPKTLGLFEKRIEGDDSLMELARLRFRQASLGAEMHGSTPEQLEAGLRFRPTPEAPVVVHLPRELNLAEDQGRRRVAEFASRLAGRVCGLVLHDHPDMAARPEAYLRAAREMEGLLREIQAAPMLFVEYAAGLEPGVFAGFFDVIRGLRQISACIDAGHVGIRQTRHAWSRTHPGQDICALKSQPAGLPEAMPEVEAAVQSALPAVLDLIGILGSFGKPVHFHLHDGHPLSTFSPFGVSDHLSFLAEIPLPFEYRGRRLTPPMFGPDGLRRIVAKAMERIATAPVSFTLEIHPTFERLPLGDAAPLFAHWVDKTNAEMMNHWLWTLSQNQRVVAQTTSGLDP